MSKPIPRAAKSSTRRLESGKVGQQVAGAANVEIKATIEAKNLKAALKLFGLKDSGAEERIVYFFDTPKLELFRAGVIVRARRVPGSDHDSTIKIRPVQTKDVAAKWKNNKGFKLEADAGDKGVVLSASISRAVGKGVIKRVVSDKSELSAVFDKDQELFLAEMCRIRYRLDKLEILGPIAALWWKVQHPGLPFPMTAELWTRGDRDMMLEVSIRVPVAQAAFAKAGFMGFLAELGAKRDDALQTKTLWALDYYAKKLSQGGKPKRTETAKAKEGEKTKAPRVAAKTRGPKKTDVATKSEKQATAAAKSARKSAAKRTMTPKNASKDLSALPSPTPNQGVDLAKPHTAALDPKLRAVPTLHPVRGSGSGSQTG